MKKFLAIMLCALSITGAYAESAGNVNAGDGNRQMKALRGEFQQKRQQMIQEFKGKAAQIKQDRQATREARKQEFQIKREARQQERQTKREEIKQKLTEIKAKRTQNNQFSEKKF